MTTGYVSPREACSLHAASASACDVDTSNADSPIASALDLDGLVEDRVHRHLLAEVVHGVAVVREDRADEVLADVVHVAEHGRQHDDALAHAFLALEELLEVRDGLLHHLGRLQHERQDQLARAELVADFLHRRQQHVVEHVDRIALSRAPRRSSPRCRPCGAAGSRCGCAPRPARPHRRRPRPAAASRRRSLRLEVLDHALQRVRAAVEHEIVAQLALRRRRSPRTA